MKQKFKEAYMDTAVRFAELSHAVRLKVGAIIVKDDRIISIGFNGTPSGWDNNCEYLPTPDGPYNIKFSSLYISFGNFENVLFNTLIISPLPAPSSIKLNFFGQPRFSQNEITQIASISEHNTDILGAVIKSPLFPNGTFLT